MYVQREKSRQKVRETRGKGSDFLHVLQKYILGIFIVRASWSALGRYQTVIFGLHRYFVEKKKTLFQVFLQIINVRTSCE